MMNYASYVRALAAALLCVTATAAPVLAQDVKDTLRVAMYQNATTLGNVYGINFIWPHMYWWEGSYDSFVRTDEKGQAQPFAVEKWELVNPTTHRLTFRKDIVFWNGRSNDATNIVKAFDFLTSETGRTAGIMRNLKVASYKAIDTHTVEFVTPNPDPLFVPKLAAFYVIDVAAFNEMGVKDFTVKPVASGPFRIVSWTDQEQVSTAHERSWRPAKTKNMRIVNVPETSARLAALESGQMDVVFNLNPDDVPRVRAAGHVAAVESSPFVAALALFTVDFANKWGGKAPFADKRVRQAANYAINKEAMVNQLLSGLAKPSGQPAVPTTYGYNPAAKAYPYDLAKAKQLMAEAGYANGFSTIMETSAVFGAASDIFQLITADLGKIGINIEVNLMPFAERSRRFNGNSWKGDLTSFTMTFSPTQDISAVFQTYGCGLPNTFTCIPELTPLIEAQAQEMDPAKRQAMLQELAKRSNDEALALYLFEGFDVTGLSKRVRGYKNWNKVIHYEAMSIDG